MAEFDLGLKELEKVTLKATYNMDVGNLSFNEGEVITQFDSIQLGNFSEVRSYVTARGGFDNQARVVWDTTREVNFMFTKGIFNKLQFAILQNAKIIELSSGGSIPITEVEQVESDEEGLVQLKYPVAANCVVRDKLGNRISYTAQSSSILKITDKFKDLIVSYDFNYTNAAQEFKVGQRFLNGYMALEARTKVKDDITGQTHTGILKIPKLKLASDLSMRLGDQAGPMVGSFKAIGYPVGSRGSQRVMELYFLEDDIDSDM